MPAARVNTSYNLSTMSRFHLALIVALAVAGAAVTTSRRRQIRRSPRYSLQRLADAARAKDRLGVERYLDVRRVAESVVDAAAESSGQEEVDKAVLVPVLEQSIWTTLTDSSLTRRYAGIADVEQREGVARVGVRLRLQDADSALVVHLRMEPADGGRHWRVVGVEDLGPYLHASLAPRLERAHELEMRSALRTLLTAEGAYFADHGTYSPSLSALAYFAASDVSVEIIEANRDGWRAVARHPSASSDCRIAIGTAVPTGDVAGELKCSRPSR